MNLPAFIELLRQNDELHQLTAMVSCELEVAALCRNEFKKTDGGKALLFTNLLESDMALVANLFGTQKRLLKMLRCESMEMLAARFRSILQGKQDFVRSVKATCQSRTELVLESKLDITTLPAIRCWPAETGRYLTLAMAVTADPEKGGLNLGLYRAEILSGRQIALNFAPGSGADRHLQTARKMNKVLPVSLFLGSDPAYLCAAAAPLPERWNEFDFCSAAFGTKVNLMPCFSQDLVVPADAEVVIEGYIDPAKVCTEGPFGNHTGQYVTRDDCPLLQVTAIAKKSLPVLPVTVVGPPPSENVFLGKVNETLIREMLRIDFPQIVGLRMPLETIFHGVSLLKVRSSERNMTRQLIRDLWHNSPLKRGKIIILLDEDIELDKSAQCWWRTVNMLEGARIYQDNGRMAIDATGVDLSSLVKEDLRTQELLKRRMNEYKL